MLTDILNGFQPAQGSFSRTGGIHFLTRVNTRNRKQPEKYLVSLH